MLLVLSRISPFADHLTNEPGFVVNHGLIPGTLHPTLPSGMLQHTNMNTFFRIKVFSTNADMNRRITSLLFFVFFDKLARKFDFTKTRNVHQNWDPKQKKSHEGGGFCFHSGSNHQI